MKKKLLLLTLIILTLTTTGCTKEEKTICTKEEEQMIDKTTFITKKGKVKSVHTTYIYEKSAFGFENDKELTESDKQTIKYSILSSFNLEEKEYKGLKIDITFNEKIEIKIEVDLRKISQDTLHNMDFNIRNTNVDISNVIYSYELAEYSCK